MSEIKTIYTVGELRAVYKTKKNKYSDSIFTNSELVYEFIMKNNLFPKDQIELYESAYMILVNRQNKVIAWAKISEGGNNNSLMPTKKIFQYLFLNNAEGFIIVHNHPSGNLTPSESDLKIFKKLNSLSKELEILLIDSIIVTKNSYYSFADNRQF